MKLAKLPDFSGKVVYVTLGGGERYNQMVESPHFEVHGDKLFLVGTVPPHGSHHNWSAGVVMGIAWEHITDYLVFDSIEDYRQRLAIFWKKKRKG